MVRASAPDLVRALIFFFFFFLQRGSPVFITNFAFFMIGGGEVLCLAVVMLCFSYTSAYSQQIHLIANTIFADLWQRRLIQI